LACVLGVLVLPIVGCDDPGGVGGTGGAVTDGQWDEPTVIEVHEAGYVDSPRVAVDPSGNAIAVWSQRDGAGVSTIMANRFTPAAGWNAAELLTTDDAGDYADSPRVAIDANGNAIAVWTQAGRTWANRFTPAAGWGVAERIATEDASGLSDPPQVAIDANGNAIAVWIQVGAVGLDVWFNRFSPDTGWGVPEPIDSIGGVANFPQIALDANGNAVAVWSRKNGGEFSGPSDIWSSHFTPASGWSSAARIETDDAEDALSPQVAVDPSGQAFAVWSQGRGVWANRFAPGSGWGVAERIATGSEPRVAVHSDGQAVAVWRGSSSISSSRFSQETGWGVVERITAVNNSFSTSSPQIAIDASGNALTLWQKRGDGGSSQIWANRYTTTTGWGVAEPTAAGSSPQVAVDANGQALAVWSHTGNIWAGRFGPDTGWGLPERIAADYDVGDAQNPRVGPDRQGNALVVWTQAGRTWANRFTPAGGWDLAERIATDDAGDSIDLQSPQIVVDPDGDALAVWSQLDRLGWKVWANRFTPASGWGVAETVAAVDSAESDPAPQVAVDPNGNALAVWSQSQGLRSNMWASHAAPGTDWAPAEQVATTGDALDPRVAADPHGGFLALWVQRYGVWSNRFSPATGWGVAERIATDDDGADATQPQILVDPNGSALAIWSQHDGTRSQIWANRFSTTNGWAVAERITTDGDAYQPEIVVNPDGSALAIWSQYDGTRSQIWANRFSTTNGWAVAERITAAGDASGPKIAVDSNGQAFAVWYRWDGAHTEIWANRFTPDTGWGIAERITTDDAVGAFPPHLAVDPEGHAVAVWSQAGSIWSSRFE
jgi:hypothetical protein